MAARVALPNNLTGSTLTPSSEGISGVVIPPVASRPVTATPASTPISASPAAQPALLRPSVPMAAAPIKEVKIESVPNVASPQVELPHPTEVPKTKRTPGYAFNPLNIIWLILIFLAVFLILYTTKINAVTDLVNGDRVLNSRKLIFWSVLVTLIIGVLGYVIMSMWKKNGNQQ